MGGRAAKGGKARPRKGGLMDVRLYDGQLAIEFSKEVPPPKTFRRFSYDAPRFWEIREQHRRCGIDKRGGRILGEVRDGHGRGGRISEHEKRREGRGWHGAFGFGACGTAAAPRFGNAGWISGGAPPQERGAKRPEDRAWRSLCSHGALRIQSALPEFCMNNPCSTVVIQGQRAIRRSRKVCSPRVARFRRICIVLRGFAV
jgi:hypothetical protein